AVDLYVERAVGLASFVGLVVADRAIVGVTDAGHARAHDALGIEIPDDGFGARLRQLLVLGLLAFVVGVALDDDVGVRVLLEHAGELAQVLLWGGFQLRLVGVETDSRGGGDDQRVALAPHDR